MIVVVFHVTTKSSLYHPNGDLSKSGKISDITDPDQIACLSIIHSVCCLSCTCIQISRVVTVGN